MRICDPPLRVRFLSRIGAPRATSSAHEQRDQHGRADDQQHEDRPPRPEHLAERQIEDPQRGRQEARSRRNRTRG